MSCICAQQCGAVTVPYLCSIILCTLFKFKNFSYLYMRVDHLTYLHLSFKHFMRDLLSFIRKISSLLILLNVDYN